MPGPLPWAPRPHPGEALSGWVARVASRYDVTTACLCRHLLGGQGLDLGRVERLDYRADPELVGLLAAAARIAPARLRAMRVAVDDGTASCWFRRDAAWCPECVRGDLARGPETYERAIWRLGCSVICPDHGVLLQDACRQCWKEAWCRFRPAEGWLGLACSHCQRLPYSPDYPVGRLEPGRSCAFDVLLTPGLAALVTDLQRDLQAALLGAATHRSWGIVRSGPTLLHMVRDLTFSIVLSRDVQVEQRTELVVDKGKVSSVTVLYEPITPAALSSYAAFSALAIIAPVLDSVRPNGTSGNTWRQDGVLPIVNAASFVAWLTDGARRWLRATFRHWDEPVCAAFWAASR